MKKVMIALAAVALAMSAQAASFKWQTMTGQYVYQSGTSSKLTTGTVYLFDSATLTQAALLDAFAADADLSTLSSLASTSMKTTGAFSQTDSFDSIAASQVLDAYFAVVNGDEIFVSGIKSGTGQASATTTLNFSGVSTASKAASTEWTAGSSFSSAGWYTAVPEPTSGLLMLVGLAGLALRRRRA